MRSKRGSALKFGLGHRRFLELPKAVAELVVESGRFGKVLKACFNDPETLSVILFFHEGGLNKEIELLVVWCECSRLLKRLEGLVGLIVALVSLRKQILDACVFMAPVAQFPEDGNRFWEF